MKLSPADILKPGISVVVPVYNSEETLDLLVDRLEPVLRSLTDDYELQSAMGAGTARYVSAFRVFRTRLKDAEPLSVMCKHFLECIETGSTPRSDGESGLRMVKLLAASDASLAANGAEIEVAF